jgi:ABC-2 type transport system permease protein
MATLFNLAFCDIEENEKLTTLNISIINNEEYNNDLILKTTFKTLENDLFNIEYTSLYNARKLLEEKKIIGYLNKTKDDIELVVNKNGMEETIFKYVVDEIIILQTLFSSNITSDYSNNLNYQDWYQKILTKINEKINVIDTSPKQLSYTMIEYYTLIAMTCLYGGIIGMYSSYSFIVDEHRTGIIKKIDVLQKFKLYVDKNPQDV